MTAPVKGDTAVGTLSFAEASAAERKANLGRSIVWYVPALALAAVFGAATGLGGNLMMIFAFGAMGGLVLLFAPVNLVLGFFIILTFMVVGPLASIAKIGQALWAPYMIALILLMRVPMEWYHNSILKYRRPGTANQEASPVMWAVASYLALILLSIAVNLPSPLQVLIGGKLYIFIWGVFFLLVVSPISPESLERMWKGFLLIAVLQFPFVLYQRVFEVGRRAMQNAGITVLDAIVGTFPGGEGGGANGSLAMFCVFSTALAISLWRNKRLGNAAALLVVLASLASIALGEVKVIIVVLPLAYMVLNRHDVLRRPLYFLGIGALVLSIVGGIFTLYRDQSIEGRGRSVTEHIERAFDRIFDPNNISFEKGEVGRIAALNLWYRDGRRTPQTFLVGYGPGASQDSTLGRGVVASRYTPLGINSTTAAGMLWDIGVLGLASFVALIIIAFFEALRLSSSVHIPRFHRSALEACAVMMALVGAMIPYDSDMLTVPQFQVLFLLALFQIAYWRSRVKDQSRSPKT